MFIYTQHASEIAWNSVAILVETQRKLKYVQLGAACGPRPAACGKVWTGLKPESTVQCLKVYKLYKYLYRCQTRMSGPHEPITVFLTPAAAVDNDQREPTQSDTEKSAKLKDVRVQKRSFLRCVMHVVNGAPRYMCSIIKRNTSSFIKRRQPFGLTWVVCLDLHSAALLVLTELSSSHVTGTDFLLSSLSLYGLINCILLIAESWWAIFAKGYILFG